MEDAIDSYKEKGEDKYNNKKKNEGNLRRGRVGKNRNNRGRAAEHDRATHHSRRMVLDQGIKDGAQEAWLPTTTCAQKRKPSGKTWNMPAYAFEGFKKFRYRGEICQLLEKNNRTPEENDIIKQMIQDGFEDQSACRRCQYYFKMLGELPDLDKVDSIQDVKEMYRNRNITL